MRLVMDLLFLDDIIFVVTILLALSAPLYALVTIFPITGLYSRFWLDYHFPWAEEQINKGFLFLVVLLLYFGGFLLVAFCIAYQLWYYKPYFLNGYSGDPTFVELFGFAVVELVRGALQWIGLSTSHHQTVLNEASSGMVLDGIRYFSKIYGAFLLAVPVSIFLSFFVFSPLSAIALGLWKRLRKN